MFNPPHSDLAAARPPCLQLLVFYTWSIRLLADSIGLFGSTEKLAWLANHTPQEGGRLAPPALVGSKEAAEKGGCCGGGSKKGPNDSTGKSLPPAKVGFRGSCCGSTLQACCGSAGCGCTYHKQVGSLQAEGTCQVAVSECESGYATVHVSLPQCQFCLHGFGLAAFLPYITKRR